MDTFISGVMAANSYSWNKGENMSFQLPNRKPIKEMNDDDLIFWLLFDRDSLISLRNWQIDCPKGRQESLKKDILDAEERFEELLAEVKDRMRKGGKRH